MKDKIKKKHQKVNLPPPLPFMYTACLVLRYGTPRQHMKAAWIIVKTNNYLASTHKSEKERYHKQLTRYLVDRGILSTIYKDI